MQRITQIYFLGYQIPPRLFSFTNNLFGFKNSAFTHPSLYLATYRSNSFSLLLCGSIIFGSVFFGLLLCCSVAVLLRILHYFSLLIHPMLLHQFSALSSLISSSRLLYRKISMYKQNLTISNSAMV